MRSIKPTGRVDRIIIVALKFCEIKFSMDDSTVEVSKLFVSGS